MKVIFPYQAMCASTAPARTRANPMFFLFYYLVLSYHFINLYVSLMSLPAGFAEDFQQAFAASEKLELHHLLHNTRINFLKTAFQFSLPENDSAEFRCHFGQFKTDKAAHFFGAPIQSYQPQSFSLPIPWILLF